MVDLTDPEYPELLSGYRLPSFKVYRSTDSGTESWLSDMEITDGIALTISHSNMQIWDISERGNIQKASTIGTSIEQYNDPGTITSGKMFLLLSKNVNELVHLAQDGGIATFGINTLDELNREFGINSVTEGSSLEIPEIIEEFNNYKERTYLIEFSQSVDVNEIWDAYMDNPDCIIAEFIYTDGNQYSTTVTVSPQTASVINPIYSGNTLGGLYGPNQFASAGSITNDIYSQRQSSPWNNRFIWLINNLLFTIWSD